MPTMKMTTGRTTTRRKSVSKTAAPGFGYQSPTRVDVSLPETGGINPKARGNGKLPKAPTYSQSKKGAIIPTRTTRKPTK